MKDHVTYKEIAEPKTKRGIAFLEAMVAFTVLFVLTFFLPFESHKGLCQIGLLICTIVIVWYLYRFALTPFEYAINSQILTITRGDGRHRKIDAAVKLSNIKYFCPAKNKTDIPEGTWYKINCCPNVRGKRNGWVLYCITTDGKHAEIHMEPSDEFIQTLRGLTKNKVSEEI